MSSDSSPDDDKGFLCDETVVKAETDLSQEGPEEKKKTEELKTGTSVKIETLGSEHAEAVILATDQDSTKVTRDEHVRASSMCPEISGEGENKLPKSETTSTTSPVISSDVIQKSGDGGGESEELCIGENECFASNNRESINISGNDDNDGGGDERKWTCKACSSLNHSNITSCSQCLTSKRFCGKTDKSCEACGGGEEEESSSVKKSLQGAGNKLWSESSCSIDNDADKQQQTCYTYDEDYWIDPPASGMSGADEKWPCPLCTFENWPASTKCSMCYTLRDVFYQRNNSNNRQDCSNNNIESIENNRVLSESSYAQRLRNRKIEADSRWLEACRGVIVGNIAPVEEYLATGGDPARQLTAHEVSILNRPSAFDVGYTLVHLALRFQHQETLAMLLSHLDCSNSGSGVKRVPSYVAPDLDQDIRNYVMSTIRYGKGNFRCNFSSEIATFTLPAGIHELPPDTRETLYDEILDHDVQKELESGQFINWSPELTVQLKSRLYALWNRSAGDCLLDSVLQATWGIFDKDNRLRQSLANSLRESSSLFYQRWRENEILLSHMLDFSLDETQCAADWNNLLSVAGQPGSSLEQLHIFALAHIFRRPIIVYSVKFVKSYLGETLGYARYEGVYLPLLWDSSLCWKSPIALGYTRGHFSALVPEEPHGDPLLLRGASAAQLDPDAVRCTYLPLQTVDGNLLPIHFLSQAEVGNEEIILSQWLDLCYTNSGIMVARQGIQKRPLLVDQLVEEWLNHYRTLGQMTSTPYMRQSGATCYSSDGDSDND